MSSSPVPIADDELVPWCDNWSTKFPSHGPTTGFTAAEVSSLVDDALSIKYGIGTWYAAVSAYGIAATSWKNSAKSSDTGLPSTPAPAFPVIPEPPDGLTFRPGARDRLVAAAARVKKSPARTASIEGDLKIETPAAGAQPNKPVFTGASLGAGLVRLDWQKGGWTGVHGRMRIKGSTIWNDLGLDLQSPLVDKTPLADPQKPEIREYQMQYIDGDDPVGDWSDIVPVTVSP